MATTYKKPLKTITIKTLNGATTKTVADTVEEPKATMAIAEFERHDTIHADDMLIPFHAVDSIEVSVQTSEDITRNDPYCEETEETPEP